MSGIKMSSGDGSVRRCHPIVATFIGDYPEQLLVTCCKNMCCPKCTVASEDLEDNELSPLRDLGEILDALDTLDQGPTAYARNCDEAGIKGVVKPFWQYLPYVDIFRSITPDVLHQLYQGVVKHLVSWIKEGFDPAEIDARCRRLPPNHNIRFFSKGITPLSRVSGKEHSDMCRILLGLVIGLPSLPGVSSVQLLRSVRSLLDFLYIAQFPSQTAETLEYLKDALDTFHNNKSVFVDLGVRTNFNLPKLHSLLHYFDAIRMFGTTDNYNTEYTERLHIDLAKEAYRATNHKDEYPQMTIWLERREKVFRHQLFIDWSLSGKKPAAVIPMEPDHHTHIKMTLCPSVTGVSFENLISDYGAIDFRQALTVFIAHHNEPDLTRLQLQTAAYRILLPFQRVPVFHTIKFWNPDPLGRSEALDTWDVAHVRPRRKGKNGFLPARMDTVLVDLGSNANSRGVIGECPAFCSRHIFLRLVIGCRVAQVRAVFRLSPTATAQLFDPDVATPKHLAYVEWFSTFGNIPNPHHGMYKLKRSMIPDELGLGTKRLSSIIEVADIRRSVHLFPHFGRAVPREWTSDNVLDMCSTFYLNCFTDRHAYITMY